MPLTAGETLGPYEILNRIGAGGMGEVYKARDTRLDRAVAIKVLPEHIAKREDLRARFEREARAVASLNHPHICVLYDIGNQDGVGGYMVMEYLQGETLEARIEKGSLPLDGALQYAAQIADALDRAHRAGVTHRDIKPGNIMLTRDGVKVLDFGLAKSTAKPGPNDTTIVNALTTEGTVLGTPQYMAPEQFEGKEADARTDIWAFGAVLYEMVTGQRAFQGKSYSSLVAAVLGKDPVPMSVKPFTPAWLERLVRRCLAKDAEDRWQSMRDLVLELRTPIVEDAAVRPSKARWIWAVVTAIAFGTIGWLAKGSRQPLAEERAYRSQLLAPDGGQFDMERSFAISPDGQSLVFATAPGTDGLWIRPLAGTTSRLLPGTKNGARPFWSPDGRSIAYHVSGKLWRVDVSGGTPIAICETPSFAGGAWTQDGNIVFGTLESGLRRVAASGGTPQPLTTPDVGRGETAHRWPQLLSVGRILFQVVGKPEQAGIYATSWAPIGQANPREVIPLVYTNGNGMYAAGHLLWLRGSTLVAQRFDPERLKFSGEPRPVADSVGVSRLGRMAAASSSNGLLVHHGKVEEVQLTWLDRAGKAVGTLGQRGSYRTFSISPDGGRVAVGRESGSEGDLWIVDVERDAWSRFTFLPGVAWYPVWSPDGRQVMFSAGPPFNLYRKESNGAGTEQRVTESTKGQSATDWSRDGRLVLYQEAGDLWVLPLTPDGKPEAGSKAHPYLRTRFQESDARFSPEPSPRWVAYTSDESGKSEVYIQAFPEPRGKFQISTGGGMLPAWSPDGRELYYVSGGRKAMAVALKLSDNSVAPSTPRELFALPSGGVRIESNALAPDGRRFLVKAAASDSRIRSLEVVVNWPALLKQGASPE